MPDRESVITHLMIMETWAEYALEAGRNFFEKSHIKSICEWTGEALELLKEQDAKDINVPGKWISLDAVAGTAEGGVKDA